MISALRLFFLMAVVLAPSIFMAGLFARQIYLDSSRNLRDAISAADQGATVGGCPAGGAVAGA